MSFKISIIGLGLMGGSLGCALRGFKDCSITGFDINPEVTRAALEQGAVGAAAPTLNQAAKGADMIIFCSDPDSIISNMRQCLPLLKSGAVVTDICGVKHNILCFIEDNLPQGVHYAGLHPMAGKELGGFANAEAGIFKNAGFIIIPHRSCPNSVVALIREMSFYIGAGRIVINTAEEHDALIAYTSDLMHIASAALCSEYPLNMTMAHTAGAFRDCTRIARLDADLWTHLLTQNADNLLPRLNIYIDRLTQFAQALKANDTAFINNFLKNASDNKEKILEL